MSKLIKSWWIAFVSIFGAMMYAYDLISRMIDFGIIGSKYFGTFGLLLFLFFGSFVVAKAQYTTNEFLKSKPFVKVKDFGVEAKGFRSGTKDAVFVDFFNETEGTTSDSDATDLYANVVWYDINGNIIESNSGRWWIPFPNEQRDKLSQQAITLKSNGMPRRFHFAIKENGSKNFCAWYRTQDGYDLKTELTKKYYKVEITLKGNNSKSVFIFFVENKKGKLLIRSNSKPAT